MLLDYILVGLIGGIVGTAELTSRYGNLRQIFGVGASWAYVTLNVGAGILVYGLTSGVDLPVSNEYMNEHVARIMLSGTSAMFLLRSSFGSFKIGGNVVELGPTAFLQVFLNEADRAYDRRRSEQDLKQISKIMEGVNFKKVKYDLPTACLAMMKNVSLEEQQKLKQEVNQIDTEKIHENTKSLVLGLILAGLTGAELLREAVGSMGDRIKGEEKADDAAPIEEKVKKVDSLFDKYKK